MKKKIYLTVLAIVTVFCIIFGSLRHMGGFGSNENVRYDTEKMQAAGTDFSGGGSADSSISGKDAENTNSVKNGNTGLQAKATDTTVTEMHVDIDYGGITIKTGDEFSAEYNGSDDFKPEVSLKDGNLTIIQQSDSWNFIRNIMNPKAELTVTLPKGIVLDTADIQLDLGNADFSGLTVRNGSVENNMGNIEFAFCRLGTMNIQADMGDVLIEDSEFYDLDIEEDLGNVRVSSTKDLSSADIQLETDLGKVVVNGNDQGTAYSVTGTGDVRLSVQNDMGDVEVKF